MSAFLFYSSPPRSSQSHYQTSPTSFFTPQVHGSRVLGWPQLFSPTLPSSPSQPATLHTSKNVNIMRSPTKTVKHVRFQDSENGDISMQEHRPSTETSSISHDTDVNGTSKQEGQSFAENNTNQYLTFQPPVQVSVQTQFDFSVQSSSLTNMTSNPRFRFQQRSRDMSSPSVLSTTISNTRTARQSGSRFLNRLRQNRHDRRDQRGAETVEQIDFFDERRKRAAYFEREAQQIDDLDVNVVIDVDLNTDMESDPRLDMNGNEGRIDDEQEEEDEMSPTEDKEVEDLVRRYYEPHLLGREGQSNRRDTGMGGQSEDQDDLWREDDESEYDRVFMELLSQEQNSDRVVLSDGEFDRSTGMSYMTAGTVDGDTEMS